MSTDLTDQFRPIVAAFAAFRRDLLKAGEALGKAMSEWAATPEGRYVMAVVDYYDRHPAELEAMIAAREAEARVRYCDCMCGRWGHRGACTTHAVTERLFTLDGDRVTVPLCGPCAAGIDSQRTLAAR